MAVTEDTPPGYRAAIIGTGFMGRVHAHAVLAAGGEVTGVLGSAPDRARTAAGGLRARHVYTTMDELLSDDTVDVVHVCTPNASHERYTLAALEAGRHVVCEKPLSVDADSAARMVDMASRAGRIGTVPFAYRFHPMVRQARAMVRAGELGTVTLAHGGYLQDWLTGADDDNWRVDPRQGGRTRAFADIGSHWCDLLEFVTGDRISTVCARLTTVNPTRRGQSVATEDIVTLQFATVAGVVGTGVISQVSPGRKNRLHLEVSGSAASVHFDQEQPETLWLGGRDRNTLLTREPDALAPDAARLAVVPAGHPQGYQDCFNAFTVDTAAAIIGDAPDGLPTFADGLRAARLTEAVLTSAEQGGWVGVPA